MGTLLTFIIILGVLVFVHELGHFVAARIAGVGVNEFGFGFPPRLWSVKRKNTTYSVNWIFVGGFVRLHGEDGEENDANSFTVQRPWKRAAILLAGVVMNVVLAWVIFSTGFLVGLPTDVTSGTPAGSHLRNEQVQIVDVATGSGAAKAGLQTGDAIVSLNGVTITSVSQAQEVTKTAGAATIEVVYRHSNKEVHAPVTLALIPGTTTTGLGVGLVQAGLVSFPFFQSLWEGMRATGTSLVAIVVALWGFLVNLVVHHQVGADVAGPVGIAVLTGQVARLGFAYLLQFAALLSLNLAIINILPIPALDGGRILFLIIEKLRGKPLSRNAEARIHNTGFVALLALIALVTLRDVVHLQFIQDLWKKIF